MAQICCYGCQITASASQPLAELPVQMALRNANLSRYTMPLAPKIITASRPACQLYLVRAIPAWKPRQGKDTAEKVVQALIEEFETICVRPMRIKLPDQRVFAFPACLSASRKDVCIACCDTVRAQSRRWLLTDDNRSHVYPTKNCFVIPPSVALEFECCSRDQA